MRVLIGILIALLLCLGGWKVWEHWQKVSEQQEGGLQPETKVEIRGDSLDGLPYQLVPKLMEAQQRGPQAMKQFLDTWRTSPGVKDPRLAWIELDYVNMIATSDPLEAKRIFLSVKQRTPTNSVIYPRIRSLSKSYE
jgi:hypothetical protein